MPRYVAGAKPIGAYTPSTLPAASSVQKGTVALVNGREVVSDGKAWSSPYNAVAGRPKLCFIGSSLTRHANNVSAVGAPEIVKVSSDSRGWPTWLLGMLQGSVVAEQWGYKAPDGKIYGVGSNRGVSGQYASQIYDRRADIAAMNADIYIIQQGTNDLSGLTVDITIDAVQKLARYLRNTGAIVILLTEPCRSFSTSYWGAGSTSVKRRAALNKAKRKLAMEPGIYCVESDKYIMLPTGEAKAGYLYDGTHFSPTGAYWWAKAIFEVLAPLIAIRPVIIDDQDVYDAVENPSGNRLTNPRMTAGTGWTRAGLPTGVTSVTIVDNADGSTTFTVVTDGTGTKNDISSVYYTQTVVNTFAVGDAIRVGLKLRSISRSDNLFATRIYARASKTGQVSRYVYGMEKYLASSYPGSLTSYMPVVSEPLWIPAPILPIPFDAPVITVALYIDIDAGVAGTSTFTIEGVTCASSDLPWILAGVSQDTGYATQPYYGASEV